MGGNTGPKAGRVLGLEVRVVLVEGSDHKHLPAKADLKGGSMETEQD